MSVLTNRECGVLFHFRDFEKGHKRIMQSSGRAVEKHPAPFLSVSGQAMPAPFFEVSINHHSDNCPFIPDPFKKGASEKSVHQQRTPGAGGIKNCLRPFSFPVLSKRAQADFRHSTEDYGRWRCQTVSALFAFPASDTSCALFQGPELRRRRRRRLQNKSIDLFYRIRGETA